MKITDGVEMLDIPADLVNGAGIIHPVVLWDSNNVILVDTGLPCQLQQFRDEMSAAGIPFKNLNKVIITHHDLDHIGSLRSIIEASSQKIEVFAHEFEKPYIQAEIPPVRMTQLEASLKNVSDEQRQRILPLYENLKANYSKFKADVTRTLADGEELPYCGGIEIIHTPGHTKGHISLYLKQSKTLIAGDMLNIENQLLLTAPKFTIIDNDLAAQSLNKLTCYDIDTVICYHGGLYHKDVNHWIAKLASDYK
jgi:glyoxylase-like metal-dependent hydrolase (beta-lactamase superfamily II)